MASVIVVLLVLASGVTMCWTALSEVMQDRVLELVYNNLPTTQGRAVLGITGVVLCLLVLIVLLRLLGAPDGARRRQSIVFAGSLGEVRVAVDTIERYLSRVGLDVPDVEKLVPHVRTVDDGNRVAVDATVHVTLGRNVREVSEQIADHIANHLKNALGVAELGDINVIVREVQPPHTSSG